MNAHALGRALYIVRPQQDLCGDAMMANDTALVAARTDVGDEDEAIEEDVAIYEGRPRSSQDRR